MNTNQAAYKQAIRITPSAMTDFPIIGPTLDALYAGIGCHTVDVISLTGGIDLWVDDEGMINGSPLNLPVTIICHVLGVRTAIFGTGIFLAVDTDDGETASLTEEQADTVRNAIRTRPSREVLGELLTTLDAIPGIHELLRYL